VRSTRCRRRPGVGGVRRGSVQAIGKRGLAWFIIVTARHWRSGDGGGDAGGAAAALGAGRRGRPAPPGAHRPSPSRCRCRQHRGGRATGAVQAQAVPASARAAGAAGAHPGRGHLPPTALAGRTRRTPAATEAPGRRRSRPRPDRPGTRLRGVMHAAPAGLARAHPWLAARLRGRSPRRSLPGASALWAPPPWPRASRPPTCPKSPLLVRKRGPAAEPAGARA